MRHLFAGLCFLGLSCACAAAQDSSPSPTPNPDEEQWLGRGEIPWVIPPVVEGDLTRPFHVEFSSPVVLEILAKIGIPLTQIHPHFWVVRFAVLPAIQSRHVGTSEQETPDTSGKWALKFNVVPAIPSRHVAPPAFAPLLGKEGVRAWKTQLTTVEAMVPALRMELPRIRLLTLGDQAAIMKALLASWTQFYALVGPPVQQVENHFGKLRMQLQARAEAEGITPQLLQDAQNYQTELNAAAAQ